MNLDEFSDYKISIEGSTSIDHILAIRHQNCPDRWVKDVPLSSTLGETNLKWLMIVATEHWNEAHQNGS